VSMAFPCCETELAFFISAKFLICNVGCSSFTVLPAASPVEAGGPYRFVRIDGCNCECECRIMASSVVKFSNELPISPTFIDFLARSLDRIEFCDETWPDQVSEAMNRRQRSIRSMAQWRLERLMSDEAAQEAIDRVHQLFTELMTGELTSLERIHRRHRFLVVVGVPRTGGSFLTAALFSSLGYQPTRVPAALAHDGFPDAQPLALRAGKNTFLSTMRSISEYLLMVEMYFATRNDEPIFVPKKLTKAIYAGDAFNMVLGQEAEYWLTIRHPIAACISTYEKSGGLPANGLFQTRSTIEKWISRDLMYTGVNRREIKEMSYFDAYVRYWEQYYINLAIGGLTKGRTFTVVPFSKISIERTADLFRARFKTDMRQGEFISSVRLDARHPSWTARANDALSRVAAVWRLVGLPFPANEIAQCY
jgi:hypothetical protein